MITKRSNRWFVSPGGYFFTVAGLEDKDKKERKIGFFKHKTISAVRLAEPEGRKREVAAMRRKYGSSPAGQEQ